MDDGMIGDLSQALAQEGVRPLVEAGAAFASLADPARDLLDIGSEFGDLAETIKEIAADLDQGYDRLNISPLRANAVELQMAFDLEARTAAARKAKRALIGLVALIAELDNSLAEARG